MLVTCNPLLRGVNTFVRSLLIFSLVFLTLLIPVMPARAADANDVQARDAATPAAGQMGDCNYRTNGLYDGSLCWLDFSAAFVNNNVDPAALFGDGVPMTFNLGDGIKVSLNLRILPALPGDAAYPSTAVPGGADKTVAERFTGKITEASEGTRPLEAGGSDKPGVGNWGQAKFGHSAYLPRPGEEHARPVLGNSIKDKDTDTRVRLNNISISYAGSKLDRYSIMMADGESTDLNEEIGFFAGTNKELSIATFPATGRSCGSSTSGLVSGLDNAGENYVGYRCVSTFSTPNGSPIKLVEAFQPNWVEVNLHSVSLQGAAFGIRVDSISGQAVVVDSKKVESDKTQFNISAKRGNSNQNFIESTGTQEVDSQTVASASRAFLYDTQGESFTFESRVINSDPARVARYVPTWRCVKDPDSPGTGPTPVDLANPNGESIVNDSGQTIGSRLSLKLTESGTYTCTVTWSPAFIADRTAIILARIGQGNEVAQGELPDSATVSFRCTAPDSWSDENKKRFVLAYPARTLNVRYGDQVSVPSLPADAQCALSGDLKSGPENTRGVRKFNLSRMESNDSQDSSVTHQIGSNGYNSMYVWDTYTYIPAEITVNKKVDGNASALLQNQDWTFTYQCTPEEAGLDAEPPTTISVRAGTPGTMTGKAGHWCRISENPLPDSDREVFDASTKWELTGAEDVSQSPDNRQVVFHVPNVPFNGTLKEDVSTAVTNTVSHKVVTVNVARTDEGADALLYKNQPFEVKLRCQFNGATRQEHSFFLNAGERKPVDGIYAGSQCSAWYENIPQQVGTAVTGPVDENSAVSLNTSAIADANNSNTIQLGAEFQPIMDPLIVQREIDNQTGLELGQLNLPATTARFVCTAPKYVSTAVGNKVVSGTATIDETTMSLTGIDTSGQDARWVAHNASGSWQLRRGSECSFDQVSPNLPAGSPLLAQVQPISPDNNITVKEVTGAQNNTVTVPVTLSLPKVPVFLQMTIAGKDVPDGGYPVTVRCQGLGVDDTEKTIRWTGKPVELAQLPVGVDCTVTPRLTDGKQPAPLRKWTVGGKLAADPNAQDKAPTYSFTVTGSPQDIVDTTKDSTVEPYPAYQVNVAASFPGISIEKTFAGVKVLGTDSFFDQAIVPVGQTRATVTYTVTNSGAISLRNVTVADPDVLGGNNAVAVLAQQGDLQRLCVISELQAGQKQTCTVELLLAGHAQYEPERVDDPLHVQSTVTVTGAYGNPAPGDNLVVTATAKFGLFRLPKATYFLPETGVQTMVIVLGAGIFLVLVAFAWKRRNEKAEADDNSNA